MIHVLVREVKGILTVLNQYFVFREYNFHSQKEFNLMNFN